ncbi:MAG: GNVR domain-containing protein [Gammaproteobacteria bacterium]|jgi:polysaccharide chain length determinant protein (PEP-CTERM system associated)
MRELYEQLLTYARGVWRYRWFMMLVAWLISIVGWGIVYQLPDKYTAEARINVDTQSMLQPLLRGLTIGTNASQRVQLVTRTLLSRPNLEKLTRMTDLDLVALTPADKEELLDDLGSDIEISSTREQDLYTISYSNSDRQLAKRVVQSLLTIFVESTLGENREETDSAQAFVEQQIKEYEAKLMAAEMRLAEFKRTHVGMMPGSAEDYYGQLQAAKSDLQQAQLSLREVINQRNQYKQQMEDDEDSYLLFGELQPGAGSALDMRIQELYQRMDDLLIRYTEKHPDVVEIRFLIAELEQRRDEERALMDDMDIGPADNPLYQQMKMQLSQADATVASMRSRVEEYQRRVDSLQEMVDTIPKIEAELKQLDRDYSVHQENYQALLSRREAANISEQAELSGDQLKFRVVDPPRVPLTPSEPNRPLLVTGVLLVSIISGALFALLLFMIRPTFDNARTVMEVLGRPVLGGVSMIRNMDWSRRHRHALMAFSIAGIALLVLYAGVMTVDGFSLDVAGIQKAIVGRG